MGEGVRKKKEKSRQKVNVNVQEHVMKTLLRRTPGNTKIYRKVITVARPLQQQALCADIISTYNTISLLMSLDGIL